MLKHRTYHCYLKLTWYQSSGEHKAEARVKQSNELGKLLNKDLELVLTKTTSFFKSVEELKGKSDYHAWKMTLDLILEENDAMDYAKGRIEEPPLNASASTQTKYKKGEVKAKKIIVDSIHKPLVAYISNLETSKEMYERLIGMFKVNNAN